MQTRVWIGVLIPWKYSSYSSFCVKIATFLYWAESRGLRLQSTHFWKKYEATLLLSCSFFAQIPYHQREFRLGNIRWAIRLTSTTNNAEKTEETNFRVIQNYRTRTSVHERCGVVRVCRGGVPTNVGIWINIALPLTRSKCSWRGQRFWNWNVRGH